MAGTQPRSGVWIDAFSFAWWDFVCLPGHFRYKDSIYFERDQSLEC